MTRPSGVPMWRAGFLAGAVFLVCLAFYLPTASTTQVNTDAAANSLAAWHLAHTGVPWMDGLDLREAGKVAHYGVGRDGHMVTTRTPGQIWVGAPFYFGTSGEQEDWSFDRGSFAAATTTAAAVAFMFLALYRRRADLIPAVGGTAVFALATPVWSVSADALWTHPVTLLGICGAASALVRDRWWSAGIWFGVGMLGRPHVALIAAIVGLGLAWNRRSPAVALRMAVPTTLSLALLSAWSQYVFDTWDPRGAYAHYDAANVIPGVGQGGGLSYLINLAGFLVSPDRGLFVWTPLLLLLIPAVRRGWRFAPAWCRWLAVGGVVYGLAQAGLNVFHGGDGFYGYRLALEPLACATPLYVWSARDAGKAARLLTPLVTGVQFAAIALGAMHETLVLPFALVWTDNSLVRALTEYSSELAPPFVCLSILGVALSALFVRKCTAGTGREDGAETSPSVDHQPVG